MPKRRKITRYSRARFVPDLESARAVVSSSSRIAVVERGGPRWVVFRCPDGCRDTLTINVDRRTKGSWRVRLEEGKVSLAPSVWRTVGCGSHFILHESKVLFCSSDDLPPDAPKSGRFSFSRWISWIGSRFSTLGGASGRGRRPH